MKMNVFTVSSFFSLLFFSSLFLVVESDYYCRGSNFDNSGSGSNWSLTPNGQLVPSLSTNALAATGGGGREWFFVAPPRFRGNFVGPNSTLQFSFLSFNLFVVGEGINLTTSSPGYGDVIITGTQWELFGRLPSPPSQSTTQGPTTYLLSLADMRVRKAGGSGEGNATTPAAVANVLSYVTCLKIRGNFSTSPHITILDNFLFCDSNTTNNGVQKECPTSSPPSECSGNGRCFSGKCVCNSPNWSGDDCSKKSKCPGGRFFVPPSVAPRTLTSPPMKVKGMVVDDPDLGGTGIENVTVTLYGAGSHFPLTWSSSDSTGKFEISYKLSPQFGYTLKFDKLFYESANLPLPPLTSSSLTRGLNVVLQINQK